MADPTIPATGVTVLPGVVDRHVHLGLVDAAQLAGGPVVEVHDLGWDPGVAAGWCDDPPAGVTVWVAGPFHTAPGGYPTGRSWAPAAAVREVADPADAAAAVAAAAGSRASAIKIVLHAGMPLLGDAELRALVSAAHDAALPAVVHAEGSGQAVRAIDAGADALAHAPWTERVPDDALARGRHMTWISTLAIHDADDQATAIDNIRRFRAVGGRLRYGTDMGNGPTPVGVNDEEIRALGRAGLDGEDLLEAVAGPDAPDVAGGRALVAPHPRPTSAEELIRWLADAARLNQGPSRRP